METYDKFFHNVVVFVEKKPGKIVIDKGYVIVDYRPEAFICRDTYFRFIWIESRETLYRNYPSAREMLAVNQNVFVFSAEAKVYLMKVPFWVTNLTRDKNRHLIVRGVRGDRIISFPQSNVMFLDNLSDRRRRAPLHTDARKKNECCIFRTAPFIK